MDHEPLAVVGRQIFCLLVTLLRPIIRVAGGGLAVDLGSGRRLLPQQQGEIELAGGTKGMRLRLKQTLINRGQTAIHASFAPLLPRGTVVYGLTLQDGCPQRGAGVGPRWAVREEFEATRFAGGTSALVSEDAPGIFSYEVAGLRPQHAVTTTLEANFPSTERFTKPGLRLRAGFTAAAAQTAAAESRRILHLGTSRRLDAVIGIVERRRGAGASRLDSRRLPALNLAFGVDESADSDVFVTCERSDGASAAFRGTLADRPTRLVLDLEERKNQVASFDLAAEVAELLREHEESDDELRRQEVAARITEISLQRRYATLWTSLLALGDATADRRGESAQVVA